MDYLGYAAWWSVGAVSIPRAQAEALLGDLQLAVPPPKEILPHDAFRRLTSEMRRTYPLEDAEVELTLHNAPGPDTMMVRHIVRTVTSGGIVRSADKVGDCAFYRPPRGQNHRARMRVTVFPEALPDRGEVEEFAAALRAEYDRALTMLDAQAIRRLVRNFLRSAGALYASGVYLLREETHVQALEDLFQVLGPECEFHAVPLTDDPRSQRLFGAASPMKEAKTDE